jgi:hypothetical protein
MNLLRTFLVLLLCAVLPLSGLAASGLAGQCPMQAAMAAGDGSTMQADMPGCDVMKSTSAGKAKGLSCKVTAQCQLGSLYHPASVPVVVRPVGLFRSVVFHYAQSLSVHEPGGLWRPPRTA